MFVASPQFLGGPFPSDMETSIFFPGVNSFPLSWAIFISILIYLFILRISVRRVGRIFGNCLYISSS